MESEQPHKNDGIADEERERDPTFHSEPANVSTGPKFLSFTEVSVNRRFFRFGITIFS